jgi:hypothetical protein
MQIALLWQPTQPNTDSFTFVLLSHKTQLAYCTIILSTDSIAPSCSNSFALRHTLTFIAIHAEEAVLKGPLDLLIQASLSISELDHSYLYPKSYYKATVQCCSYPQDMLL